MTAAANPMAEFFEWSSRLRLARDSAQGVMQQI
jgi:hypothetical protein